MFREMRRFKQQLPEAECEEILRAAPRGVLAVLGDKGYPYATPLDFLYGDGKLYFHCAQAGHKLDALRRCPKASFCVLDEGERREGDWALWFRSVVAFGRVRIVEEEEEAVSIARRLGLKYFPTPESVEETLQRTRGRFFCLELTVEHLTGKLVHER